MCTEEQHHAKMTALARLEKKLDTLTKGRPPIDQGYSVSDTQGFFLDYKERKHLFVYSANALTFNLNAVGTAAIAANVWECIDFQQGLELFTIGQATPVFVLVRATDDEVLSTTNTSTSLTTIATNTSNIPAKGTATMPGAMPVTMATDDTLTLAIKNQIAKLLFDGNQYLKTAILNGTNQVNIAANGAMYNTQATNNASVPTGAGNTVIKASPGSIATVVVTTTGSGTGNVQIFDNATTNSGTVLFAFPATVNAGTSYLVLGWAKVGMTAQNVLNGPVFTVHFS